MFVDSLVFWPVCFAFLGGSFCRYLWRGTPFWGLTLLGTGVVLTVWLLAAGQVPFAAALWATAGAVISGLVANFDAFMGPPVKKSEMQEADPPP